jgi:hypothetical protein
MDTLSALHFIQPHIRHCLEFHPSGGHDILPTPIMNPDTSATITNPLRTRATKMNQRQLLWQLQLQLVSTPRSVVSSSRSIHQFGCSDTMHLLFGMGRLMELYMSNRRLCRSARDMEMVRFAMGCVAKASANVNRSRIHTQTSQTLGRPHRCSHVIPDAPRPPWS